MQSLVESKIDNLFEGIVTHSVSLFLAVLILTTCSAYAGKYLFKKRYGDEALVDDEAKIILGAILSLLGLLIGFILSIAIDGYNNRQKAEEREAVAIGNVYQQSSLLNTDNQLRANILLKDYLDARIEFFQAGSKAGSSQWRKISLDKQQELWNIVSAEAKQTSVNGYAIVLNSVTELYSSEESTTAGWRDQIPSSAWILLVFFAISSNVLIGYNIRGMKGRNVLIMILPLLTTMALFLIAEIDVPGEGIIYVTPDNLVEIRKYLFK